MMAESGLPALSPAEARQLVTTLRDGVAPIHPIARWLTVGQEVLLRGFARDLAAVAGGGFRRLLLLGDPGAGKSHLMTVLRYLASEGRFVTAHFSHDVQSKLGFNRPDQIYRSIIDTLQLPDSGAVDAINGLMTAWAGRALQHLRGTRRSMAIAYRLSEVGLLPTDTQSINYRTRVALVGYVMATEQQQDTARREFLGVLRGPGLSTTDLFELARSLGLNAKGWGGWTPTPWDTQYYFGQLGTLTEIIRSLSYPGLVVLFDEVTAIIDLKKHSRKKAYSVLDSLFFNEYGYRGLYMVFAYLPPFITKLREDSSEVETDYLKRWGELLHEQTREVTPLNREQRFDLLHRLALLHGLARGWDAWGSTSVAASAMVSRDGQIQSPRELVRKWITDLEATYRKRS